MINPYQPTDAAASDRPQAPIDLSQLPQPGLVRHVQVLGVLMMVQAAFEILYGIFMSAFALIMPAYMQQQLKNNPPGQPANAPSPLTMSWMLFGIYGVLALLLVGVGLLRIWAGYRTFQFRGRVLGIASLVAGFATVFGCYCLPTAFALAIYGLIVYLNPAVIVAFELGQRGYSSTEILTAFATVRQQTERG